MNPTYIFFLIVTVSGGQLSSSAKTNAALPCLFSSLCYRDGDVELIGLEEQEEEEGSRTLTSTATSTAYSLIETAHPVFGRVKRLWNSPLESHREVGRAMYA